MIARRLVVAALAAVSSAALLLGVAPLAQADDTTPTAEPASYTVTLDPNGGRIGDSEAVVKRTVTAGDTLELPTPTWSGHSFQGWFAADTSVGASVKVTADLSLTAHWTTNPVSVTWNANGGVLASGAPTLVQQQAPGASIAKLPAVGNRAGWAFLGWFTAQTGGTMLADGWSVPAQDVTVWAHWTNKVSVVFDTNGGSAISSRTRNPGTAVGGLGTPRRGGFAFMGWYSADRGGSKWTSSRKVPTTPGTLTIHARWAPKPMYQSDPRWRNERYHNTVGGSGCGPGAVSIVARAAGFGGGSQTPSTAAKWMRKHHYDTPDYSVAKTKTAGIKAYLRKFGLTVTQTNSDAAAKAAVKEGKWVVARMNPGFWTIHQHYIVWYDIEGKRALVRDPNGAKASKTRNTIANLQRQAATYFIVGIPDNKKVFQ